MPLLSTDAVILHAANYLESSRILRLATRDAGVQSVVARGMRSSKKRFGSAVDLFASGQAHLQLKPGRDLHTLTGFDVTASRPALAADLSRFAAASAVAEVVLRLVHDEPAPMVYLTLVEGLDRLGVAEGSAIASAAMGALWQLVAEVGFRPTLDECGECHQLVAADAEVAFRPASGGVLCDRCARQLPGGRRLPAEARNGVRRWLLGELLPIDPLTARAHQRLFREFIGSYLPDSRPLKAFASWEQGGW